MRPAWRLAISNLSERRSRTLLLAAAVALSASLISAVACGMASLRRGVETRLETTVGAGDLRLRAIGGAKLLERTLADEAEKWPEVARVAPRLYQQLAVSSKRPYWEAARGAPGEFRREYRELTSSALAIGVVSERERLLRPLEFVEGGWPERAGEIVLDTRVLERLGREPSLVRPAEAPEGELPGPATTATLEEARELNLRFGPKVGDEIEVFRLFQRPVKLRIVGIAKQPPLGGRPQAYMTLDGLGEVTGRIGQVSEIDLTLRDGADAEAVAESRRAGLPEGVLLQTTEKVTSGLRKNMESNRVAFYLASMMSFLAAAFIITTALTTAVTERQRELAVVRCVGGTRGQLAESQLAVGAVIGLLGGIAGVPIGIGIAALAFHIYRDRVQTDLYVPLSAFVLGLSGSLFAGLVGAGIPAWRSARVSPLKALAIRAERARPRGVALVGALGAAGLLVQLGVITIPQNRDTFFWLYVLAGAPALFIGYFLLSVPLMAGLARAASPLISAALGLPRGMLGRAVRATPYRFGFTAGAMMLGLALMVTIWAQGRAIMDDFLGKVRFPDAFVVGLSITPETQQRLNNLKDIVTDTCAISMLSVESESFGVRGFTAYKNTFIAFEPEPFFRMTELTFVQGDRETAVAELKRGGAVMVAREFLVANGMGVGDVFRCRYEDRDFEFRIVAVVTSPGLDLVNKFFQVGEEYVEQSMNAVFGTRTDLERLFLEGQQAPIQMIQIGLRPEVDEEKALERIRVETIDAGVIEVGSGRGILTVVRNVIGNSLLISSGVAVLAMVIASFGVANLIVAGIQARRFEFGVLRAVGATRGVVLRLVIGEAVLIALAACILGTLMGLQGLAGGRRLDELLFGLVLSAPPPLGPVAAGWAFVIVTTLIAAAPAVVGLSRRQPRELLAAVRG